MLLLELLGCDREEKRTKEKRDQAKGREREIEI